MPTFPLSPPSGPDADRPEPGRVDRSPLDETLLAKLLAGGPAAGWRVDQVLVTGSTNADLAAAGSPLAPSAGAHRLIGGGAPRVPRVLVAHQQRAGRGRLGRQWVSPAGAGLTFSVRLGLAEVPLTRRHWVGAVLGLAVVDGIGTVTGLAAALKWPNDVQLGEAKLAGVLAELTPDGDVVVGTGVNVSLTSQELPRPDATSLTLAGAGQVDRTRLLAAIVASFAARVDRWARAGGDSQAGGVLDDYRRHCGTLGREVRIELPGGRFVQGRAVDIDPDGAVVVSTGRGRLSFRAGDVTHLRPVTSTTPPKPGG